MKTSHYYPIFIVFLLATICFKIPVHAETTAENSDYSSVEERRLQEQLKAKGETPSDTDSLISRQNDLKILEQSVDMKLAEVEKKIAELKKARASIEALLTKKDAEEQQRLNGLAKIYEKMAADKAALAIAGLDIELASDLLSAMKPKAAAEVLNQLPRAITSELTTKFSATQLE